MLLLLPCSLHRLGQEAKAMMVPTVEDVFHADTNSTDDYLGEIQSMTILTAIQVCLVWCTPACPQGLAWLLLSRPLCTSMQQANRTAGTSLPPSGNAVCSIGGQQPVSGMSSAQACRAYWQVAAHSAFVLWSCCSTTSCRQ
jgi:hypothetical protein